MTTSTYALIEGERHRLADLADGWIPEQWDVPSLAEGWRVREVVAHLTMPFALRANAAARFTPPGMGPEAPLTDLVVHGLDVRIPLGLPATDLDHDALAATLRFLATRSARHFGGPADAFATRRLAATDVDWSHGTGPTERAPATDLIAHLCRARPLPQM